MIIKEMNEQDLKKVVEIFEIGVQSGTATFRKKAPTIEEWNKYYLKNCRYVANIDNDIAGWVAICRVSSRECYTGVCELSIYVDPKYKNRKVGSTLLNHLIKETEKYNIWTLQSTIIADNVHSFNLHKGCGFSVVGKRNRIAKNINGEWKDTILMEKRNDLI